ncbi:hypothetical protein BT96DRAFT_993655 [Gymnopus androsaceus JB14]|uniref:Uncharacterized protein n=1 Tax=Gymnopus androsaceus JB14 TaxID=1447944 RepID=A0A6A4HSC1_9AGAR|nr:hypothetical protein BT96DRAFT_993655 [Gymnopus androsaceus JB14]
MTQAAHANYALRAVFFMMDHLLKDNFDSYTLNYEFFRKAVNIKSDKGPNENVEIWPWDLAPTGEPWKDTVDFEDLMPTRQKVYHDFDDLCNCHARLIPALAGKVYGLSATTINHNKHTSKGNKRALEEVDADEHQNGGSGASKRAKANNGQVVSIPSQDTSAINLEAEISTTSISTSTPGLPEVPTSAVSGEPASTIAPPIGPLSPSYPVSHASLTSMAVVPTPVVVVVDPASSTFHMDGTASFPASTVTQDDIIPQSSSFSLEQHVVASMHHPVLSPMNPRLGAKQEVVTPGTLSPAGSAISPSSSTCS